MALVTAKAFAADAQAIVKMAINVADDDLILDIGPQTAALLATQLKAAGTIVWNGTVGAFEFPAFENGTKVIAHAIADSSAFLELLEGKTLPAFEILQRRAAGYLVNSNTIYLIAVCACRTRATG